MDLYTVYAGPMFAGKTTHLVAHAKRLRKEGKRVLVCKWESAKRADENGTTLTTHDGDVGETIDCVYVNERRLRGNIEISNADVVCIDDAQFFYDIREFCTLLRSENIGVVVATLLADYKMAPWSSGGSVAGLVADALDVRKLLAECAVCHQRNAVHSRIKKSRRRRHEEEYPRRVLVGGSEMYEPVCLTCYVSDA